MKRILFDVIHYLARTGTCHGLQDDGSVTYSRNVGPLRFFRESSQYDLVCITIKYHELIAIVHDRLGNYEWFSEVIQEAIINYFDLSPGSRYLTTIKLALFDLLVYYSGEGLIPLEFSPAVSRGKLGLSYKWMKRLFGHNYCPF
jgi:hypothetical protein